MKRSTAAKREDGGAAGGLGSAAARQRRGRRARRRRVMGGPLWIGVWGLVRRRRGVWVRGGFRSLKRALRGGGGGRGRRSAEGAAGEAGLLEVDGGGGDGVDVVLVDRAVGGEVPCGVGAVAGGEAAGEGEGVDHVEA